MTSTERVIAALSFQGADYVPLSDAYWGITVQRWRERQGLPLRTGILPFDNVYDPEMNAYYGVDLIVVRANDEFFPSRAKVIREEGNYRIMRDGWGRLLRSLNDGTKDKTLQVVLASKHDLDKVDFESPYDEGRYTSFLAQLDQERSRPGGGACTVPRVGGPFLRCWWLRGEEQFLIDIAEDPNFVNELVGRVVDHRIAIGLEEMRRGNLYQVGLLIADDIAYNRGMFISPRTYQKLFLPHMARMVQAFKTAGAARILFHSDGDIRAMLDAFIEIGISAVHPVEPRAGMDIVELHQCYRDKLAFVGGLDNTGILPGGTCDEVRAHVLRVLQAGQDGGVVIGSHSIGADISLERYEFLHYLLMEYGRRPRPGTFL